jgi:transposase-like protein
MKKVKPKNITKPRIRKKYSYALKRKVVNEIMLGITTKQEAKVKYSISSTQSINCWLRKYALVNYDRDKIYPMKQTPKERIKELEARIKELEDDKYILNTTIDVIDEMYNTDIRKKYLPQSLKKFKKTKEEGK